MKIYKDSSDKIYLVSVVSSFQPPEDWTLVCENPEELPLKKFRSAWVDDGEGGIKVDLPTARNMKLEEIRAKRDAMLKKTDERYVEELSKGNDTTAIEADKATLRDLPATAETELSSKIKDTTIDTYDPFADLQLSESYE